MIDYILTETDGHPLQIKSSDARSIIAELKLIRIETDHGIVYINPLNIASIHPMVEDGTLLQGQ